MGDKYRVYSRSWDSVLAEGVTGIIGALAALDGVFAVVEEVTSVRVMTGTELSGLAADELDAVTVFWPYGQVALRRRDAERFCGSAIVEEPQPLATLPPGSNPDVESSCAGQDHVVRSLGTQRVESPDGTCALYEARMGKPLSMPAVVCGAVGAQFTVRVYRDKFGRQVLSRFAALEGVNA